MRDAIAISTLLASMAVFVVSIAALFVRLPKVGLGTRGAALRGLGIAFVLLVVTMIVIPTPDVPVTEAGADNATALSKAVAAPPAKPASAEPAKAEDALPFNFATFAQRFNALAEKQDQPWRIRNVEPDGNSFKYMITDKMGLVGSVTDSGELNGIVILAGGDGTATSGLDVFMLMTFVYCAAIDEQDLKHCGRPVLDLTQAFQEGNEESSSRIINDIEFTYSRSDVTGNMFTVSPASD